MSEPKKMEPNMTLVGIPVSLPDGEIITNIAEKSVDIKGCTVHHNCASLKQKENKKMLLLKCDLRLVL